MARWVLPEVDYEDVERLKRELGILETTAEILVRRGYKNPQEAWEFINPTSDVINDPFLMKDMEKAVEVLLEARKKREPVLIYGDYDVDGITGTALLKEFLEKNGWNVLCYIPHRVDEGYGVQPDVVKLFAFDGVRYIVTVDCGITAYDAVQTAKRHGIKMVITDHHEIKGEIPPAEAVINPKRSDDSYPFKELAGVGVAYKLVQALSSRLGNKLKDDLLDLVALGTVADMVPLLNENRYFVKKGLETLSKTKRPGLRRLIRKLGLNGTITAQDVSYKIAPKINAAGRMGSAEEAFNLIVTTNYAEAEKLVRRLFDLNYLRRETESKIFKEAIEKIELEGLDKDPIIAVVDDNWHVGVIGIVAAKLAGRYSKPVVVISLKNGLGRGSARSANGANIMDIFLKFSDHFYELGGHSMAVGFTIDPDKIPFLLEKFRNVSLEREEEDIVIDAELKRYSARLVNEMNLLRPFGQGNPEPCFLMKDLSVERIQVFGEKNQGVRMTVRKDDKVFEITGYGFKKIVDTISQIHPNFLKLDAVVGLRPLSGSFQFQMVDLRFYMDHVLESKKNYPVFKEENKVSFASEFDGMEKFLEEPTKYGIFMDIKERNSLYLKLINGVKKRVGVISLNNSLALNIYHAILRHFPRRKLGYLNSLVSKKSDDGFDFMTLTYFMKNPDVLREYDVFVLNEPAALMTLSENELVQNFLNIFDDHKEKFLMIGSTLTNEVEDLISNDFRIIDKSKRVEFMIMDLRDREILRDILKKESYTILFSDQKEIPKLLKKAMKISDEKDITFYANAMKDHHKMMVMSSITKDRIRKFICSTNTDGLPSILGEDEVYLLDFPLTSLEIIDAIQRSGMILNLAYSEEDILKREKGLEDLFPRKERIEEITRLLDESLEMELDTFKGILREEFSISESYIKIYLRILEDLGYKVMNGKFVKIKTEAGKNWRSLEGELEFSYFEITKSILTKDIRSILKALLDRRKVL